MNTDTTPAPTTGQQTCNCHKNTGTDRFGYCVLCQLRKP